jgi:hypothetical protein
MTINAIYPRIGRQVMNIYASTIAQNIVANTDLFGALFWLFRFVLDINESINRC